MQIKLESIEYCDDSEQAQAIIYFVISHDQFGSANLFGMVNEFIGKFGFGLFCGIGGDFTLLEEFNSHCDEATQKVIRDISSSQNYDANDPDDLNDFLEEIESQAQRTVPHHVYTRLKEIRKIVRDHCV